MDEKNEQTKQREQEIQKTRANNSSSEENPGGQMNKEQRYEDVFKKEEPQKTQSSAMMAGSPIKSVILWVVCFALVFLALPCLLMQNVYYILFGIVALILAALACPPITAKAKDIPVLATLYQIKIPIAAALVIVAFVLMYFAGLSLQ